MSIGPPSDLVSCNLFVPGLGLLNDIPVKLLPPANGLPFVSELTLVIVIALPFTSESVSTVGVAVTVRLAILAALISSAMSSGVDTPAYCDPAVVKLTWVSPEPELILALKFTYPPVSPYIAVLESLVIVLGVDTDEATTNVFETAFI